MPTTSTAPKAGTRVPVSDLASDVATPVVRTFLDLAAINSPARAEAPCAAWVRSFAESLGLGVDEDDAATTIPDGAGSGNLYVRIPATAPGTPLFFCAHTDTVATADDTMDPVVEDRDGVLVATNRADAILGGDNKAAVAVMLELMRDLASGRVDHAGVEFVFTPCEEVGLLGAKAFDASRLDAAFGYVFDHANDIGKIVVRAPTQTSIRATFTGQGAHSGIAPEDGRSAILAAARAISSMPHGRVDEQTTANVGIIEGGTATNIVPAACVVDAEVRSLDHARCAQVTAEVLAAFTDAATRYGVDLAFDGVEEYRGYSFTERTPAVALAARALDAEGETVELVPCGGGSDANVFNAAGVQCVNLCNAMRRIHTSDEYVELADLDRMLRVAHAIVRLARDVV